MTLVTINWRLSNCDAVEPGRAKTKEIIGHVWAQQWSDIRSACDGNFLGVLYRPLNKELWMTVSSRGSCLSTGPQDDGIRGPIAITVSVVEAESEKVRLILDDVDFIVASNPKAWQQLFFYTSFELERALFDSCDLPEEDLAGFGRAMLIALSARWEHRRRKLQRGSSSS